jgi:hypothetical protein
MPIWLNGEAYTKAGAAEAVAETAGAREEVDGDWPALRGYRLPSGLAEGDEHAFRASRIPRPADGPAVMDKIDVQALPHRGRNSVLEGIVVMLTPI